MDTAFSLPEELEQFRKLVRKVAEERVEPRAAEIDATDEFPHDIHRLLVESELMAVATRRSTAAPAAARSRWR